MAWKLTRTVVMERKMKMKRWTTPMPRLHPRKPKKAKKPKLKARKSELNVAALTSEQEALAALSSNQLLHLRLRKKYYAEALAFIRNVEKAMETMVLLLGATNKTEVLETMEFFRVAYEYQLDSADVSRYTISRLH